MANQGGRAADYRDGISALCRVARGYTDAARFDDAAGLLRGLAAALTLPDVPPAARAEVAGALAEALLWRGSLVDARSFPEAAEAAEHAVAAALSSGDPAALAAALLARARVAYHRYAQSGAGDLAATAGELDDARRWAELAGDGPVAWWAAFTAGLVAEQAGRAAEAAAAFETALAAAEAQGYGRERGAALHSLGLAAARAGRLEQAEALLGAALAAQQAHGPGHATPFTHLALGELQAARGGAALARRQYETGLAIAETSGSRRAQMQILVALADLHPAHDVAARPLLERAAAQAADLGDEQGGALIRARLARLAGPGAP